MEAHNEQRLYKMFNNSSDVKIMFIGNGGEQFEETFTDFESARDRINELDFDHQAFF